MKLWDHSTELKGKLSPEGIREVRTNSARPVKRLEPVGAYESRCFLADRSAIVGKVAEDPQEASATDRCIVNAVQQEWWVEPDLKEPGGVLGVLLRFRHPEECDRKEEGVGLCSWEG